MTEPATAYAVRMPVSPAEQKLLLRLRQLGRGSHLLTLLVGRDGPWALALWAGACRLERLAAEGEAG